MSKTVMPSSSMGKQDKGVMDKRNISHELFVSQKEFHSNDNQQNITKERRQKKSAAQLKSTYEAFLEEAARLFPKVDQKFLMDVLKYETTYKDWEGNAMLKIVYPANSDILGKKERLYERFEKIATVEEDRTLRVKVVRLYLDGIEKLLADDSDIEYVTGSATLTPSDAYAT